MAFATAEDLATAMQRSFTAEETATATQALDIATARIQGYTGQTISAVANESITLRPDGYQLLQLPQTPVTSIDSITEDGILLTVTTDYLFTSLGFLTRVGASWGDVVVVVYDHGYTVIPDDVKGVTLSIAAGLFSGKSDQGIVSESIGMYQVGYGPQTGGFTPDEMAALDHYRPVLVG